MGALYKSLIRPVLFCLDPERAHTLVTGALKTMAHRPGACRNLDSIFSCHDSRLTTTVGGLRLENPVGLAAGFDKGAEMVSVFGALGFGFIELGTFTPKPQAGNPKPRLVRLAPSGALVNAMGFNNPGVEVALQRLKDSHAVLEKHPALRVPIGISIGKGWETPLNEAGNDYLRSFERLYPVGDYFVLNVSSPNTPQLRRLENARLLEPILSLIQSKNREIAARSNVPPKPVFVKVSPDLSHEDLEKLSQTLVQLGAGVIATNTAHHQVKLDSGQTLSGGLSGPPLLEASTRTIRVLYKASGRRMPIIGVGGISNAETAYAKIRAGASAVQIYTGWIYEGPGLVKKINKGLVELLKKDGFKNIQEAIGAQ